MTLGPRPAATWLQTYTSQFGLLPPHCLPRLDPQILELLPLGPINEGGAHLQSGKGPTPL